MNEVESFLAFFEAVYPLGNRLYRRAEAPNGRYYYYHIVTKSVSWECPYDYYSPGQLAQIVDRLFHVSLRDHPRLEREDGVPYIAPSPPPGSPPAAAILHNRRRITQAKRRSSNLPTSPIVLVDEAGVRRRQRQSVAAAIVGTFDLDALTAGEGEAADGNDDEDNERATEGETDQISGNSTSIRIDSLTFNAEDSLSNIEYDSQGAIKAATFEKLIEKLTLPMFAGAGNLRFDLLLTYRSMCTAEEFLGALIQRVRLNPSARGHVIHLRVVNVLKHWVDDHWISFEVDKDKLIPMIEAFMTETKSSFTQIHKQIEAVYHTATSTHSRNRNIFTKTLMKAIPLPLFKPGTLLNIWILDATEIARQLTIIESEMWAAIRPQELLDQAWTKEQTRKETSPNVVAMIAWFNEVSAWVKTEILTEPNVKYRAKLFAKFLEILWHLRELQNYNGMLEIISGLNSSPIARLKSTLAGLSKHVELSISRLFLLLIHSLNSFTSRKEQYIFQDLEKVVSSDDNYKSLRATISTVTPPCVPYLGMYLTDLIFIEEGHKNTTRSGLINFVKRRQVSNVIREVMLYQQDPYYLAPVPEIQEYLRKLPSENHDDKVLLKDRNPKKSSPNVHLKVPSCVLEVLRHLASDILKRVTKEDENGDGANGQWVMKKPSRLIGLVSPRSRGNSNLPPMKPSTPQTKKHSHDRKGSQMSIRLTDKRSSNEASATPTRTHFITTPPSPSRPVQGSQAVPQLPQLQAALRSSTDESGNRTSARTHSRNPSESKTASDTETDLEGGDPTTEGRSDEETHSIAESGGATQNECSSSQSEADSTPDTRSPNELELAPTSSSGEGRGNFTFGLRTWAPEDSGDDKKFKIGGIRGMTSTLVENEHDGATSVSPRSRPGPQTSRPSTAAMSRTMVDRPSFVLPTATRSHQLSRSLSSDRAYSSTVDSLISPRAPQTPPPRVQFSPSHKNNLEKPAVARELTGRPSPVVSSPISPASHSDSPTLSQDLKQAFTAWPLASTPEESKASRSRSSPIPKPPHKLIRHLKEVRVSNLYYCSRADSLVKHILTHLGNLKAAVDLLVDVYFNPLQDSQLLSSAQLSSLFPNLLEIHSSLEAASQLIQISLSNSEYDLLAPFWKHLSLDLFPHLESLLRLNSNANAKLSDLSKNKRFMEWLINLNVMQTTRVGGASLRETRTAPIDAIFPFFMALVSLAREDSDRRDYFELHATVRLYLPIAVEAFDVSLGAQYVTKMSNIVKDAHGLSKKLVEEKNKEPFKHHYRSGIVQLEGLKKKKGAVRVNVHVFYGFLLVFSADQKFRFIDCLELAANSTINSDPGNTKRFVITANYSKNGFQFITFTTDEASNDWISDLADALPLTDRAIEAILMSPRPNPKSPLTSPSTSPRDEKKKKDKGKDNKRDKSKEKSKDGEKGKNKDKDIEKDEKKSKKDKEADAKKK